MWFGVAERRNIGNSNFQWLDQDIQINGGDSYTWNSRSVYNGVTPEYKMVYGTYRYQYYSTDLHSSGNTEGTFTQRTYGNKKR